MEYYNLSENQLETAKKILEKEGFNQQQINAMLFDFQAYDEDDARALIKKNKNINQFFYENICCDYLLESKTALRYSAALKRADVKKIVPDVLKMLRKNNLYFDHAWALHFYSEDEYRPILKLKRNSDNLQSIIKSNKEICCDNIKKICIKNNLNYDENKIEKALSFSFINALNERSYDRLKNYLEKNGLKQFYREFIKFIDSVDGYFFDSQLMEKIDEALKHKIENNVVLYRGVSYRYARENFDPSFEEGEAKRIVEEKGFVSSSLTFGSSMCYMEENVALRLIVPQGTEGLNIMAISNVLSECEILLNSCDLYILGQSVETFYNDDPSYDINSYDNRGTTVSKIRKRVYTALVLSKNRECYNDVAIMAENQENN